MNRESLRLRTFQDWPSNAQVDYREIARAGFYYTGFGLNCQCFLCGCQVSNWNPGDQPLIIHRLTSPDCPFVLDPRNTCNVGNVPLTLTESLGNNHQSSTEENNSNNDHGEDASSNNWSSNNPYASYEQRLSSFTNWPKSDIVAPESLARAGFFYLQQFDIVQCAFCQGIILDWNPGDDPDQQHRIKLPNCTFYQQYNSNLSIEKVELDNVKLMPGTTADLDELGIQEHSAPKQSKYATYEARLNTFQGWPSHLKQTPKMLAGAGFYYVGIEDQVRCFHCDGGLRNWEDTDDVWTEHAKWFPKCRYVSIVQGPEFIKQCVEKRPPPEPTSFTGVLDEDSDVSRTPSGSSASTVSTVPSPPRVVTDAELQIFLSSPPAMAALELGLHVGRVKMAIKKRMEQTSVPYQSADQLIEDATRIQLSEEDNISDVPGSPSAELTYLLNQIITSAEAASSNTSNTDNAENNAEYLQSEEQNPCDVVNESVPNDRSDSDPTVSSSKTDKSVSLEEENRRLREARQCKICMDREVAVVFLPCGHLSTCLFCAPSLKCCPMCRTEIRATVRTFLV